MGGIGRAIGTVLVGLGEGIGQQGQFDLETQRQQALEALRHQDSMEEQQTGADLADRNNARTAARNFSYDTAKTNQVQDYRTAERKDQQSFTLKLEGVHFANDKAMAKFRSDLDTASAEARARFEDSLDSGDVKQVVQDSSGAYYGVYKDGSTKPLGVTGSVSYSDRRPTEDDSVGSIADEAASRGGGAKAQPTGQAPGWTTQDENRFRTRYANANPQTAPGLFRNGKKIPLDEARRLFQGQM